MTPPAAVKRPPAGAPTRSERMAPAPIAIGVTLVAAALLAVMVLIPSPRFVHRITFENGTPYHLDVGVTDAGHDGWMGIGTAERGQRTDLDEVFDIGDTWVFRYSAQGHKSRTFTLTRSELEARDWRITVPDTVGTEFRAGNVTVQP